MLVTFLTQLLLNSLTFTHIPVCFYIFYCLYVQPDELFDIPVLDTFQFPREHPPFLDIYLLRFIPEHQNLLSMLPN